MRDIDPKRSVELRVEAETESSEGREIDDVGVRSSCSRIESFLLSPFFGLRSDNVA